MTHHRARDRLTRFHRSLRRAVLARRRLLAAALAAVAVASGLHAATAAPPAQVPVVVAAHDLPAGSVLTPADVRRTGFTPDSVPESTVAEADLVGRTLAAPLRAGEPVTDVRLVGPALTDGYPGLTAVPVRLPDTGMAALLHVGDRIDLVAADPQDAAAAVVATDVPVLALPSGSAEATATGLAGSLVVVGAPAAEVTHIADASARTYLSYAFSD